MRAKAAFLSLAGALAGALAAASAPVTDARAQSAYDPFAGRQTSAGASTVGDVSTQKEPVDFETVQAGRDRVTRAIPLTNDGGTPIKVTGIKLAIDDEQMQVQPESCLGQELGTGARCTVALTWKPSRPGRLANVLMVEHSGRSRSLTIPIKGVAQPPGFAKRPGGDAEDLLVPSPDQVDFGTASLKTSASRAVIVTNIDEQPVMINRVDLVGNPQTLRLSDDSCTRRSIEPGRACLVTLLYTPATAADLSINMVVHHSGPRGYLVIPITSKPPAAAPGEIGLAAAPGGPGRPGNGGGLPSLIPDNEVDAQGMRLKLIGTSGKVAILDRGGKTQIVNSGQSVTLEGTTYKVAVAQGNVTLTPPTGTPIQLDGEEGAKITAGQNPAQIGPQPPFDASNLSESALPLADPQAARPAATKPSGPPASTPARTPAKSKAAATGAKPTALTPGNNAALTPPPTSAPAPDATVSNLNLPTVTIGDDRSPTAREAMNALQTLGATPLPGTLPPAPAPAILPPTAAPVGAGTNITPPQGSPQNWNAQITQPARASIVLPDHIPAANTGAASAEGQPMLPAAAPQPPSTAPALPRPLTSLPQPTVPLQMPGITGPKEPPPSPPPPSEDQRVQP